MLTCIAQVLTAAEIATLRGYAEAAAFEDGRVTAGRRARRVKNNQQMVRTGEHADAATALVREVLNRSNLFRSVALPRHIYPPLISRYRPGMNYGAHVDNALMGKPAPMRTDLATTIFLSDPGSYEGGELRIDSPFGPKALKLPPGDAVVYPASTLHQVVPVISGERLAAVTWIQSHVRDPMHRELLHEIEQMRDRLAALDPDSRQTDLASKSYTNLLRMWAEF